MSRYTTAMVYHGVFLMVVRELVLAIASQQVKGGNYIVPRTTLELSPNTNKSAEGHKRICTSNLDCEMYTNNQCCPTISGYWKCRKRCKPRRKFGKSRPGKGKTRRNKHQLKTKQPSVNIGCIRGPNKVYKEGEREKAKDGCNECICQKGEMICTNRKCRPGKCSYRNKLYDERYVLVLHNGCKRCVCQYSSWNCKSHPCEPVPVVEKASNSAAQLLTSIILLIYPIAHLLLLR